MGFRQIFGGSTAPKYLTDGVPSNIWGGYNPEIFHGTTSVKYFGGVDPQIFHGWGSVKYLGLYTTKMFDGWGSVKYLGAVDPQNISRMGFRQSNILVVYSPKYLTEPHP